MLSILEHLPATVPVTAIAEVADADEIRRVDPRPTLDLRWRCRNELGRTTCQVLGALRRPDGPGYAWGAGEHDWIRDLDHVLHTEHALPAERRSLTSYWRRGAPTGLR